MFEGLEFKLASRHQCQKNFITLSMINGQLIGYLSVGAVKALNNIESGFKGFDVFTAGCDGFAIRPTSKGKIEKQSRCVSVNVLIGNIDEKYFKLKLPLHEHNGMLACDLRDVDLDIDEVK